MPFRTRANLDPNQHKGLIASNSVNNSPLILTGGGLTNSQPLHVAIVDGVGTQITSFGGGTQYAELTTTSPGTGTLSLGRYNTSSPSLTDGQMYGLQLDTSGNLKVSGSLSVGGTTDNSAFTAGTSTGTPAMGFYHSTIDTVTDGRSAAVGITSKRAMLVNLQTAAGVETGVAGAPLQVSLANTAANATAVKVDGSAVTQPVSGTFWQATQPVSGTVTAVSGTASNLKVAATLDAETTKVIGTVNVSSGQSIAVSQATASSLNVTAVGTGTFATQSTLQTQTDTTMVGGVNIKEINAVAPLMGNGITGTGSQRVTIASDNTAFSVNATLSAETTKVIGTARTADGAGNLYTTNSTTYTAKFAQDGNLLGTLGTAFSTAGKVDVKGADGDVFVRNATAGNFLANVTLQTQTDTTMVGGVNIKEINAVAPLMGNGGTGTGSQRVTIASDNTGIANWGQGATAATAPSGAQFTGSIGKTSLPTAVTDGQLVGNMSDKYGRQVVVTGTIRDLVGTQTTTISASTAETTIVTAAASVFNDITAITLANTSATATRVDFRDTTSGSVLFSLYVPAGDTRGVAFNRPVPQTSVNTNWTAQSSASITDLRVYVTFDKNR